MSEHEGRWAIWVDIEGFGTLLEQKEVLALQALGALAEGIYLLGTQAYPDVSERLFAHQLGDGFVVLGDDATGVAGTAVAIAIALLRHVGALGAFCKAGIARGGFADISGCLPDRVRLAMRDHHWLTLGAGLMTVLPVMGTALVRAHRVCRGAHGALLLLDEQTSDGFAERQLGPDGDVWTIDWVHTLPAVVEELQQRAGLKRPTDDDLEEGLRRWIARQSTGDQWSDMTRRCLHLTP